MNRLVAWDVSYYERLASFVREKSTHYADSVVKIPFELYRSPEIAEREREKIFKVFPLPFAHRSEIPGPNDYVAKTIMGRPLLFTRDKSGVAHVFENVCRHRAAQVVPNGCGKHGTFSCPYHGWTYSSEGKLIGVPWKEGFEGMDRAKHGLVELPSEERHGFIWVILTPGLPIDVASFLGKDMDLLFGSMGFERMTLMKETPERPSRIPMPCNWKSLIAAFQETYHFAAVHGNGVLAKYTLPSVSLCEEYGRHHLQLHAIPEMNTLMDSPIEKWRELNLSPQMFIFPCTQITVSDRGANVSYMTPDPDNLQNSDFTILFMGEPAYAPELVAPVYDAVLNEDVDVLRTMQTTQPTASHKYELIGRNEKGVQHAFKAIAAAIDVELPTGFPDGGE